MIATGNYCPSCLGFYMDDDLTPDDLKELTLVGAVVYCPRGCMDDYNDSERQVLMDSDELEVSTPRMEAAFNKKMDELQLLLSKANDVSEQMQRLSFTYQHSNVSIKEFNTFT